MPFPFHVFTLIGVISFTAPALFLGRNHLFHTLRYNHWRLVISAVSERQAITVLPSRSGPPVLFSAAITLSLLGHAFSLSGAEGRLASCTEPRHPSGTPWAACYQTPSKC